jgi:3-oxoacyl-[acyl-carrier protein] reductase
MLLDSKNVLVFAATGAIGSAAARTFAHEGAHVWISGRNQAALEALVGEIRAAGGLVDCDMVDATDDEAVQAYVARVAQDAGSIDGVFNAIGGHPADLGYPALTATQPLDQFLLPMQRIVGSQFLTARAAAHYMTQQGHGAIVTLSATLSGMTAQNMAGISAACSAIEGMTRALAGDFGASNVRVNCVRGSAMPETRTIQETVGGQITLTGQPPQMSLPPLGRPITVQETVNTAAFLLSDAASGMTGQVVTVCAGAFVG